MPAQHVCTRVNCPKRLVLRRKMHVHQVWCEVVEHNSFVSFQSEDYDFIRMKSVLTDNEREKCA